MIDGHRHRLAHFQVGGQHLVMKVEVKRLEFCTGGRSDDRIVLETLILLCLAHIQKPGGIDRTRLQILESSVLIDDVEDDLVQVG